MGTLDPTDTNRDDTPIQPGRPVSEAVNSIFDPGVDANAAEPDIDRDESTHHQRQRQARPSIAFRAFIGLLGLGAIAFNVALMLSDRAPGFTSRVFGDFARNLSDRLDADRRAQILTEGGLPESDAIVHIGVWGIAALLIGLTIWSWRWLLIGSIAVFLGSVVIEFGQGRYSTTRNVETSDLFANAAGVMLGTFTAALCFATWSLISRAVRGIRQPHR